MNDYYKFDEQFKIGDIGINYVMRYIKTYDPNANILNQNLKQNRDYGDITFNDNFSLEVKTDRYYNTGNICIETISQKYKHPPHKLGWIYTSRADYIAYLFINKQNNVIKPYLWNMKELQSWYIKNRERLRTNFREVAVSNRTYQTINLLVKRTCIVKHIKQYTLEDVINETNIKMGWRKTQAIK